jgi:hypothetical protein
MLENQTIDWDVLLPALQHKRCVLFLGPDAYPFSESQTVEQAMWAAATADQSIVRKYYADDGLVLFQKKSNRGKFLQSVQQFFKNDSQDWSLTRLQLQKIVQLPFLAIVNLTFDDLLPRHYADAGLDCQAQHYIFRPSLTEKLISALPLDGQKPLVLNLLGSIHSSDNLVLTHTDLFDFLRTLFDDKDQWLNELLHEADCFLFIGVAFEKWYLQLLLQKLSKYTKPHEEAERYALPDDKTVAMHELYRHELKIQFVEDQQQAVIERLYRHCEAHGLLNQPQRPPRTYRSEALLPAYRHILRGELAEAVAALLAWAAEHLPAAKNVADGATMASAQLARLQAEVDELSLREAAIERNKIVKSLLYLLDTADNLLPQP